VIGDFADLSALNYSLLTASRLISIFVIFLYRSTLLLSRSTLLLSRFTLLVPRFILLSRRSAPFSENMIKDAATGQPLARLEGSSFMLGAGGFGGPKRPKPALDVEIPITAPHFTQELKTTETQAMLYRLAGDTNPLHIDPAVAERSGFKAPILHGLCTYGHAARSLVSFFPGLHLRLLRVRFSSPVYPGETLVTEAWKVIEDGNQVVCAFRTSVKERKLVVLNQCVARFVKDSAKL